MSAAAQASAGKIPTVIGRKLSHPEKSNVILNKTSSHARIDAPARKMRSYKVFSFIGKMLELRDAVYAAQARPAVEQFVGCGEAMGNGWRQGIFFPEPANKQE
jgi:hypothetical protein